MMRLNTNLLRAGGLVLALALTKAAYSEKARLYRKRGKFLRRIVENIPDGFISLDANWRITYVNSASRRMFSMLGIDASSLIGQPAFQALPDLRDSEHGQAITRCMTERVTVEIESFYPSLQRWYLMRHFPSPDGGAAIVVQDITQRKDVEHALQATDRRRDEFLAMLAHELRNPLAPIRNAAEILWLVSDEPARVRETSEIIVRQARHMNEIVDDLLDVSRVTRGLITLHTEPLDLRSVITAAVEQTLPLLDSRRHQLQFDLPVRPALVDGDRVRLTQVFSNLVNNAAKYTPSGGTIRVVVTRDGGEIEASVIDNGEGIDPDLLPHVFDLFEQGRRTPDRTEGGLGIGLSLVKTLVQLHGGTIEAASRGTGQGSRFAVRLPKSSATNSGITLLDSATTAASPPQRSMRLLVVDDNIDAAEALAMMLQMDGHTVFKAYDARSAIICVQQERPEAILLDIGLPDIDGYELARRLRAIPEAEAAKLIAVTGYGQLEDRRRAEDAGFNDYLVKPVDFESLRANLADRVEA
ncbi:MAG: hybrid sensor histidine kinase/response regulator [Burkholderiaceae bacterium]